MRLLNYNIHQKNKNKKKKRLLNHVDKQIVGLVCLTCPGRTAFNLQHHSGIFDIFL